MKEETFLNIILSLLVLIVIVGVFILATKSMKNDLLFECYKNNFENITLHGDFSGEFDCNQFYLDNYEGKWMNECSNWFFSEKWSCHYLCNIDCAYYNKQEGSNMCVC